MKTTVDNFGAAILGELKKYTKEVQEKIPEVAKETAEDCKNAIKQDCISKGWKNYQKGWKVITDRYGFKVANTKYAPLVHLLEFGHAKVNRNGEVLGTVKAYPHVIPAEEIWTQKYEKRVKEII